LEFAINTLSLTFRAIQSCLSAGLVSEFNRLLDWAMHIVRPRLEDEKIYDFDRAPMDRLFAPFNTCTTLMFVYRVIDLYQEKKYDDILVLLKSTKDKPVDLNSQQSMSLSRICYNIGLTLFNQKSYENAIIWFKFCHAYGSQLLLTFR
jgi:hypothetical protein